MRGRFIVPVEPSAGHGEMVVVEVQQEGSHALDVRLVGCEGESPYVAKISHRNISKLKHKFKGTTDEWEEILSHFLLQKQPEGDSTRLLENVRMVYALKGDKIEITIQQDVKGIKVNLGEIVLPKDDEFEFNPFEWAQASAQAHARTLQELAASKTQTNSEQDTIAKLNAQLDDFIKTKNETETAMLWQFMELLNEKKRKIRDQNRLLASAKVDKTTATTVQVTREETKPRKAGASRTSKRKAKAPDPPPEPEPDQSSDGDQMDVEEPKAEEQDEESVSDTGAATPDRASETETEDEEEGGFRRQPSAPAERARSSRSQSAAVQSSKATPAPDEDVAPPPPRRELPFGRSATRNKTVAKPPSPATEDEDDETEDEEL